MLSRIRDFIYSKSEEEKHTIVRFFGIKIKKRKLLLLDFDSPKIQQEMLIRKLNAIDSKLNKLLNKEAVNFSIIMPTYNRAFCITNAIDSALKQYYTNFELIIVDDCSNDDTESLIRKTYFKELDSGKIVYKKLDKNSGVCTARNEGLKLAKNNWIAYLDSDNTISPYFLEEIKYSIDENPNKTFYAKILVNNERIIGKEFDFDELCKENYIDLGIFIHHKSLVDELGGFDTSLKRLVDWDLIIRYTKSYKPFYINKILMKYTDTDDFERISNKVSLEDARKAIFEKMKNVYGINKD